MRILPHYPDGFSEISPKWQLTTLLPNQTLLQNNINNKIMMKIFFKHGHLWKPGPRGMWLGTSHLLAGSLFISRCWASRQRAGRLRHIFFVESVMCYCCLWESSRLGLSWVCSQRCHSWRSVSLQSNEWFGPCVRGRMGGSTNCHTPVSPCSSQEQKPK